MFEDLSKTDELSAFTKELAELRTAVINLVNIMRPIAEDVLFQKAIDREIARCDCAPTRESFFAHLWTGRDHDDDE